MCRSYDQAIVKTLGNWANNENVEMSYRLEAMKMLFDRGHGRPKSPKEKTEHSGSINLTMRHIHEGKPPGEK
jgi:hypothetical protein